MSTPTTPEPPSVSGRPSVALLDAIEKEDNVIILPSL
jgi:hypothetical protein